MKIKSLGRAGDVGATEHYADPLYYTKTYKERTHDVEYYAKLAKRSKGPVLEYGIGNGRVALAIAKAGVQVTGIDLSQPMLDSLGATLKTLPKQVQARVRYHQGDMRELVLDEQLRLHVLDIQRQPVPLVLVERTPIPEVVMSPWLAELEELASQVVRVQQSLKGQRSLFDRHQPHLFVGDNWLRQVEDSFFVLNRDLERLGTELQQWRDRLPRLDA